MTEKRRDALRASLRKKIMSIKKIPQVRITLPVDDTLRFILAIVSDIDMLEKLQNVPSELLSSINGQLDIKRKIAKLLLAGTLKKTNRELFIACATNYEHILLSLISPKQRRQYFEMKPAIINLIEQNAKSESLVSETSLAERKN